MKDYDKHKTKNIINSIGGNYGNNAYVQLHGKRFCGVVAGNINDERQRKNGGFKVNFKKASNITGYQVQYATDKSFTNKKSVKVKSASLKTVTGLTRDKSIIFVFAPTKLPTEKPHIPPGAKQRPLPPILSD
ncbi:MAG: hypothetical protein LUG95_05530 [Clostridiales bacterium]|nr:hypothetical protein [Clostridiales bacterium]